MQWFINIIVVTLSSRLVWLFWMCQSQLAVQTCTCRYVGFPSRCNLSIATSVFLDCFLQCCGGAMETQYNWEETRFVKVQDNFLFYAVFHLCLWEELVRYVGTEPWKKVRGLQPLAFFHGHVFSIPELQSSALNHSSLHMHTFNVILRSFFNIIVTFCQYCA